MAKPYAEDAGSGMHVHISLTDAAGRNLFADAERARRACATPLPGCRSCLPDTLGFFAPNRNSFRRFGGLSRRSTANGARTTAPSLSGFRPTADRAAASSTGSRRRRQSLSCHSRRCLAGMHHGLTRSSSRKPRSSASMPARRRIPAFPATVRGRPPARIVPGAEGLYSEALPGDLCPSAPRASRGFPRSWRCGNTSSSCRDRLGRFGLQLGLWRALGVEIRRIEPGSMAAWRAASRDRSSRTRRCRDLGLHHHVVAKHAFELKPKRYAARFEGALALLHFHSKRR